MYTDYHLNVQSGQRQISSQVKVSTWSGGSKRCCLSFQLPRSLKDKQVTIVLEIRVTNITCVSSSEGEDKTICWGWIDHSFHSECEACLPCEMLLIMVLTAPNNYIFKEGLKEVLTKKAFNSSSVENCRQTKLRIAARIEVETKRDCWLCFDNASCKRKDINGSCFMAILL